MEQSVVHQPQHGSFGRVEATEFGHAGSDITNITFQPDGDVILGQQGSVGIGDVSPEVKLTVKGTANSYKAFFGDTSDTVKVGIYTQTSST